MTPPTHTSRNGPGPGLTGRVLACWADMRGAMRWFLDRHPSESTLLVFFVISGGIAYLGSLARFTLGAGAGPPEQDEWRAVLLSGIVFFALIWPLILYLLALLAHGIARLCGGRGDGHATRAAMAWSVLVASPPGVIAGTAGALLARQNWAAAEALNAVGPAAFLYAFALCMAEAHGFRGWGVAAAILGLGGALLLATALLPNA